MSSDVDTRDGQWTLTSDFGGRELCDCARIGVARALLWETAAQRQRIHRARWDVGPGCDARVVIAGVSLVEVGRLRGTVAAGRSPQQCWRCGRPAAEQPPQSPQVGQRFHVSGECPCRQMLIEVLLAAHQYLVCGGRAIRHPEGAARRHVGNRQHDYHRQRRGEMGAQVRTDRLLTSARARLLETDEQRQLLKEIADEAGSESPLDGQAQLELRLATLRSRRLGVTVDSVLADLRRDLAVVKRHYSAGRLVNVATVDEPEYVSWWEAYIERPLGRRRRVTDLPATTAPCTVDGDLQVGLDLPCPVGDTGFRRLTDDLLDRDRDEAVLDALYRTTDRQSGPDRQAQLERTLRGLAAEGKLLTTVVERFLADPARRSAAAEALEELAGVR